VTDFFTRWHVSLGSWIQRNVYTPLQLFLVRRWGVRRAFWAGLLALLTGWLVVGLWHRFSWLFLLYGLGMALILWLEKASRDRLLRMRWSKTAWAQWTARLVGPVYVFVVITSMLNLIIAEMLRA
jgi:D-alanyl-lipoteichoic acid acyltransferase DltB (MBOAT superfamily)